MDTVETLLLETHASVNYTQAQTCEHNPTKAETCVGCQGDQYFNDQEINYSCKDKRSVYLLRYMLVHIQEVKQALDGLRNNSELPDAWPDPVRVLSIGGGPGFDVAAFKKFVLEDGFYSDDIRSFEIFRLDKVKDWDDLAGRVIYLYSPPGYSFKHSKINQDLNTLPKYPKRKFDIFLLSYVVSELSYTECEQLGKTISASVENSAVVIFNDRNEDEVWKKIQAITSHCNIAAYFKNTAEEWCGLSYPDSLTSTTKPKLKMKSIRYGVIVKK